ncbi:MAG: DNA polymerase III subunit alpha, partial [Bacteroidota bacterium]
GDIRAPVCADELCLMAGHGVVEQHAKEEEQLYSPSQLKEQYGPHGFLLGNAQTLLAQCHIDLPQGLGNNRQIFTGNKEGDFALLKKLSLAGLKNRYGEEHPKALQRLEQELNTIRKMDYCFYFLSTWDIVRYAASMGYHYIGRGSGANSIVAYCLHITDVEPLELDLYFERFINQFRSSPPDFDIDFSWDERDDVIDYVFKRYGPDHTALLATYTTFKRKSVLRETGKAFGLPKSEIDLLLAPPSADRPLHGLAPYVLKYGQRIIGFPNYLSIHAGGIVISERPLHYHTALQMMPKGFPITQFDMYDAEELGFHKYDILSQRGLGHIKDAVTLIRQNRGQAVDIHNLPKIKQDPLVQAQLASGQCIGCFYIESPAMRGLLHKLRCRTYVHLVAASSIIRPGVAQSGMMREYIRRFHQPASFHYPHPVFEQHLKETFGVMVYQEDVMKILHHFSDLPMDEADVMRRQMTGKKRSSEEFQRLKEKYFHNCAAKGHSRQLTEEVWRQIESFSGYSFCKAHSASFAAESFQSLYLKTYFPLEFMTAVINNFGGFYRSEYYFHEARMQGAQLHPPCVNHSLNLTTLYEKDLYIGFIHLHQLERTTSRLIVLERQRHGPFKGFEDFIRRMSISSQQLDILIRIDAFRFSGKSKYELMWQKNGLLNPHGKQLNAMALFEQPDDAFELPTLEKGRHDDAFDQMELLGFPLCSPFDLLALPPGKSIDARQLLQRTEQEVEILGYFVCRKDVTTVRRKQMYFASWLDQDGHFFDTTHFPNSMHKAPFRGRGCYWIKGKVCMDFGFPSIEVSKMERLPYVKDERY